MISKTESDLRDLWVFLCGFAYASPETCKLVGEIAPHRDYMPLDVRMLLEGIETKDRRRVGNWLGSHGAVAKKGATIPQTIADVISEHHRRKTFEACSGGLDFIRHLSPGEALTKLKELAATLESAGIKQEEVKQEHKETSTNGTAKAQDPRPA